MPNLMPWEEINRMIQGQQREANLGRIPGAAGLEDASSQGIMELLNPGNQFAEVDRRSAELAGGRGIMGSGAGATAGYRMTDEERLKRMALGQQFLTSAYGRNPSAQIAPSDILNTVVTPYQQETLSNRERELDMQLRQLGLERDQFNLQRTVQGSLGRGTDARGNATGQRINIAGSGYAPDWVTYDPNSGSYY
jgi:hypothetical protein